jgi:hypothetical protein
LHWAIANTALMSVHLSNDAIEYEVQDRSIHPSVRTSRRSRRAGPVTEAAFASSVPVLVPLLTGDVLFRIIVF